jgi:CRP-like cAMP-binding protein
VAVVPTETLAKLSLFEGLPESALKAIGAISRELSLAADTVIFSPETSAEHLYVLLEGSVRLTVHVSPLSGPVTVTVLGTPGQALGFSSVVGSGHHNSSAEAASAVRVVAVKGRELMDYLAGDTAAGFVHHEAPRSTHQQPTGGRAQAARPDDHRLRAAGERGRRQLTRLPVRRIAGAGFP